MNLQEKIKKRFQFLVILFLFFPVVLDALFGIDPKGLTSSQTVLQFGIVISILILIYLILEYVGKNISDTILIFSDVLIFLNIAFLSIMFSVLAIIGPEKTMILNSPEAWILKILAYCSMWIPIIMFLVLLLNITFSISFDKNS